ncbi:hypothetical protein PR048_026566 [Dryococelus australis]|uniref:Uncharacterized protein n=1 Tax=Dryococelus australis TaxID=614101 RepID=A0ABQ9GLQ1_9NEOP|nr:hypothetical protein PR048_026566 [Dryococelus australis]
MYSQIEIHPDDRKYQKIFWRLTPQDDAYVVVKHIYVCVASSFYQSLKTLHELATDETYQFPWAPQLEEDLSCEAAHKVKTVHLETIERRFSPHT